MATSDEVLDFWFGDADSPAHGHFRAEWFRKDAEFDSEIRRRFLPAVEAALAGGLDDWRRTPQGALALLILLDQFPRNLFRGEARAFAGDARARAVADALLARGWDKELAGVERIFVYLPFEHSEEMADQERSLALFGALADELPGFADTLDYAHRHQAVIARFGRFPHRNAALGRTSTAEEAAFLATPGSGF